MKLALAILLLFSFSSLYPQNQEPTRSYTQFGVEDGLAGSTVYCMAQDHEGFLWFGTETGISRFDGTHFRNFGTADGLPTNQILEMFVDSKGRLWMAPFKKAVCYYFKGKIYNSDNDSLLHKIKPTSHIIKFAEDAKGNILIMESANLFLISGQNVRKISSIDSSPNTNFLSISKGLNGNFLVIEKNTLYEYRNNQFHVFNNLGLTMVGVNFKYAVLNEHYLMTRTDINVSTIMNLHDGSTYTIPWPFTSLKMQMLGDSFFVSNGQLGANFFGLKERRPLRTLAENNPVSQTFIDNEGNYWFTTLGEGVLRLNSENVASVELRSRKNVKLQCFSLKILPHKWFVGTGMMHVFKLEFDSKGLIQKTIIWDEFGSEISARVTAMETLKNGQILLGSDQILEPVPQKLPIRKAIAAVVKAIIKIGDDKFLVATRKDVFILKMPEAEITDVLWNERSTTVYMQSDTVYIGTLDGLYLILKDKTQIFAGKDEPLFRNDISSITGSGDGMVWVATNGAGIIGYRNGKIEKKITISDGLTSNVCRTLSVHKNELWVGTDKGLNRIIFYPDTISIVKFSMDDGLLSNVINAVSLDSNIVVVATDKGINFFDVNAVSFRSNTNLVMDDILVSDHRLDPESRSFRLLHKDNNIRFQFAGISFRSGGEIKYKYRLVGLDTTWKITKDNFLNYPTLPSGEYRLELQATNKFGIKSRLISVPFTIEELLVEKTWFRLLMLAALIVSTFLFGYWLIRRVRRRDMEKNTVRQRIAELEQLALKSQMNPHFIFNCLNSIQQFVLDKDVEGSNRFITGFSRLIRQTLDISARKEITLSEEIIYLSTYLELEKTRFENKFTYEIRVADELNVEQVYIPPMMLQPFVENSIRHGIRYRTDSSGKILVSFGRTETELNCVVEDNGVGRKTSRLFKSSNPIEYQSKGMSLIADRVEFLNMHSTNPITISIEDLTDENENPTGTRVTMKFPLDHGD